MGETRRTYRQSDELYGLINGMADRLETTKAAVLELAVRELEGRLEGREEDFRRKARKVERKRREDQQEAAREARGFRAADVMTED